MSVEGQEPLITAFGWKQLDSPQSMDVIATAYTAGFESTGKRPGDPGYGVTKTGCLAEAHRTIAVDPNVISLGSWVYIEGLGIYRAEDTGGKIKGNRIDIFMSDHEQAVYFGIRQLKLYPLANLC